MNTPAWVEEPISSEERINKQKRIINALQSHADLFLTYHREHQSFLSYLASLQQQKSWVYTITEAAVITSISICLCQVSQVGLIIGAIACTMY